MFSRDPELSLKVHKFLIEAVPLGASDDPIDHDFDIISHANCDYSDNKKGINIDVDKIIGSANEGVS